MGPLGIFHSQNSKSTNIYILKSLQSSLNGLLGPVRLELGTFNILEFSEHVLGSHPRLGNNLDLVLSKLRRYYYIVIYRVCGNKGLYLHFLVQQGALLMYM